MVEFGSIGEALHEVERVNTLIDRIQEIRHQMEILYHSEESQEFDLIDVTKPGYSEFCDANTALRNWDIANLNYLRQINKSKDDYRSEL